MIRSIGDLALASTLAIVLAVPASAQHDHDRHGYDGRGGGRNYQDHGGDHGHHDGGGGALIGGALLGLGIGALVGGAIASAPPAYYPPPPTAYAQLAPGCHWGQRRVWVEDYGYQMRTVQVCR